MKIPRRIAQVVVFAGSFLVAGVAAADPVLVEFRSADGTALVAEGDARTRWGEWDAKAARERVMARAEAIAAARRAFVATLPLDLAQRVERSYRHFPLVAMNVDAGERGALSANPLVVAVYDVQLRRPLMESALAYLGADAWHGAGYEGAGTAVAVLDTGIRYWNGYFGDCPDAGTDPGTSEGCRVKVFEGFATLEFGAGITDPIQVANQEPHATNVGGIVEGMAPGTALLSLGVFAVYEPDPSTGFAGGAAANDSDVVEALDWVIEHREEYNIVSANMSLGSEPDPEARGYCTGYMAGSYSTVFANTRDAGVLPVTATGNEYVKTAVGSPACISSAVRVGAGYDDPAYGYTCGTGPVVPGSVVCFSNSNALVDFIAPGNDIDAAGLMGYSGTSMATPMVAGLTAVYQARYGSDALWTYERMRVDAVPVPEDFPEQPYIHRYIRMGDHDAVLRFDTGALMASSYRGLSIPNAAPAGLEVSAEVICESEECVSNAVGRVFVDLNVEHAATGELSLELEAPDGTVARHDMESDAELGKDNINSILGSQHLPAIFDGLKGKPIVGTWKLRVIDEGGANTGELYRAVLLIDSARVELRGVLDAPSIARPSEPFDVTVTVANRGNLELTAAPLALELVARDGGGVVDSVPLELDLPLVPDAAADFAVQLTGTAEGMYDVRLSTTGLAPELPPGLVAEAVPVAITQRTFASFGVEPRVPEVGADAQLVDWSVGMIDSWSWDFGDGTTSTTAGPLHVWAEAGDYDVRLTVTGPDGVSAAARRIHVAPKDEVIIPPIEPIAGVGGGGCACRAGAPVGGGWLTVAGLLLAAVVLRRRRGISRKGRRGCEGRKGGGDSGSPRPEPTTNNQAPTTLLVLMLALAAWLPSCGDDGGGATDGGAEAEADAAPPVEYGPWVSLLSPADPSMGEVDLWLRVGHERSLPVDLTVEFRVGTGEWQAATLDDPSAALGVASAPEEGAALHLRWLATTDVPGDAEVVALRVGGTDGELDAVPVQSAQFTMLNFFVTNPHAVLITEVSTAERNVPGSLRDDYLEVLNTTAEAMTLDGWKLVIGSASGARAEIPLDGCTLPAGGRRSLVETDPEVPAEYGGGWPLGVALPWNNEGYGSVAIVATYDRGVDFVRWGGSSERPPAGTAWTDEVPLPVPQTLTVLNRVDETVDTDRSGDFCVAHPSPDEASEGCLPRLPQGSVLVSELDSQGSDDQIEVLNASGAPVDLAGWVLLWDGDDLGSGVVPLASFVLPDGGRLGLRDNGTAGRVVGPVMELGVNVSIDGLIPVAVGFRDPYGDVIDFLAGGGSTIRWLDWNDTHPTPMPGPNTSLSRRPGDPDTDGPDDFCLTTPNIGAPADACLEPLGITLRISEIMPGRPDWVEIYNPGPDPVDLSRVYLSYTAPYYGGSVGDYQLAGTLEPGALIVVSEADLPDVDGELNLNLSRWGNISLGSDGAGTVALRDEAGYGIDFAMWGEPAGTPLWPDVWTGLGADVYPTDEDLKSIQRYPYDAADTNGRDDWCWAYPSPMAANATCD
ncbi:MAG: lamin tail domain-containing protein [Deltaproteobacteria bacterium]|nr:lamin tail domain-containing protein [Deltaproteobacteria bacterium]